MWDGLFVHLFDSYGSDVLSAHVKQFFEVVRLGTRGCGHERKRCHVISLKVI